MEYKQYSRDIWDYIKDMPYMPSRADREKLFFNVETRNRVKLWDYFFRINPEDVGEPQKKEISLLEEKIIKETEEYEKKSTDFQSEKDDLEKEIKNKNIKRGTISLSLLIFLELLISRMYFFVNLSSLDKIAYGMAFFLSGTIIIILFVWLLYITSNEIKEIKRITQLLELLASSYQYKTEKKKVRIQALQEEISRLLRQIPTRLPDSVVWKWLGDEITSLRNKAVEEVALDRELAKIEGGGDGDDPENKNPLLVAGPGELQSDIPELFSRKINGDLNKHLTVKQVYFRETKNDFEVLYSVYFIEFIIIATDMLVTYSFFYDFIDDKVRAEHITEQYYKDVVALAIVNEFRELTHMIQSSNPIYIEDAPTFTLSLASGERHKVTFVNQDYFLKIRDRIKLEEDEINRISWVTRSSSIAHDAIATLRYYLRQHKVLPLEEPE